MRFRFIFLALVFLLASTIALAQTQVPQEKDTIFVVVKELQGERVEGYLRLDPSELTVSTKDNQEKSVPLKLIESIKVEKIPLGIPGADEMSGEGYYSVRLQNSQEIFTLRKKYTFSLNTSVGVVTRTIDPETVQGSFRKDSSPNTNPKNDQPFIRDKNVVLSLEIKF